MSITPLEALPLEELRRRSSSKWRTYPADILPLFVAETDFALAPAITRALAAAVERGDTGYTPPRTGLPAAFAGFAERRFGWTIDQERVRTTCDVMMGVAELLRAVTEPGDRVIVTPPVYPPFFMVNEESRTEVERVPLLADENGWSLDLDGIDAAFARGAKAMLLCNPHNPTGTVHSREALAELARIAHRHGAWVISDEIHAPLTLPGATFTPFLDAAPEAAEVGFALTSASKAFNLAGLKCAFIITAADAPSRIVSDLPAEVEWRTSLFGVFANVAAFEESDEWLDALIARLDLNRFLLRDLLAEHVPGARYLPGQGGYLAWVDLSALGWGDNPAARIRKEAGVALHLGPLFGDEGRGHVRINFGTGPEILTEAVTRIGALAR
ncbi:aminotransferase class I/II-fold pyridoxal phosphate-dependent enzyme [Microbacterium paludicola]|uniref:cysteine-S-conjugate beta-lyase n=1 Tax=Microbacterium paludicola TaxID=300019 RepID=A0A4Y9FZK0_9MICO|nr:aminotransferase class I/II-fold pyridoxal phosphate-dependent enzyme [Microbacterium paludicola]MBF0815635.1 aminotransferase class I/II-fold pyridoxal phosphate-dependent enzyme [Microbacterium paludicola]TFU33686.1 aminotransferase class I/II-fold pyridoxal phosphate-dependent enzyme [Microbacterium paludicola]